MNRSWTHGIVMLSLGLLAGVVPGEEQAAELTPEQQQVRQEALKLYQEGAGLYRQARLVEATERLRQAAELFQRVYSREQFPEGHAELAAILSAVAGLIHDQGEHARAEPFYRQALQMYQTLYPRDKFQDGHPHLAASLNNLGLVLKEQGEYARAEPFYRQSFQMCQTLYPRDKYQDGHPHLARGLNNLGAMLLVQGDYAQAEPLLRQALQMDQTLYPRDKYPAGHPDLARSLNNLGILLREQGEYARAEPIFRQAVGMRKTLYAPDKYPAGHPDLALSLDNLGVLLMEQGEHAQAEPFFRQALRMYQALYPREKYPNGHPELAKSLNNLGVLFQAQDEYAQAESFFRQTLQMRQALYPMEKYPNGHPELAKSLNNLGVLLQAQGEHTQAEPLLRQALAMQQAFYPREQCPAGHPNLARSLNNLGLLLRARGEHARAEPFYRQALQIWQQQADRLAQTAPEPLALNFAATFPLTRDAYLSLTLRLPDTDSRSYDIVWRTKASLSRVYQRRHLALIAAATDPSVRQAWEQLQLLHRQREQLLMAPVLRDARTRQEKLDQLTWDIDQAEKDLLPRLPALRHAEDLAQLSPNALQQRLPEDAVLIDLLRYTHFEQDPRKPGKAGEKRTVRYLAFLVSRNAIKRVELGTEAEIDRAVTAWREEIVLKVPADNAQARRDSESRLAHQADLVRQLVWEPIHKQLSPSVHTLYLAPDAALTQLPWAALPGSGKDRILLDDYAIAVLPHGPLLLEQLMPPPPRSPKRPPAPEGLLLVGGIRYDDTPTVTLASHRTADAVVEQKVVFGFLQGTEDERRLLEQLLQKSAAKRPTVLSGSEATTARLCRELEQARYAHIGTHGFFADKQFRSLLQLDEKLFERRMFQDGRIGERIGAGARNPLVLSGLVCSGANQPGTPERGILSADAIAGLLLDDLHLATLSACDTGLGDVAGGEGVFGLQRAFHIAGCKNVVASLWKVDDAATAALMTRFYSYLFPQDKEQRLPPIEALRRAQLDLYRHPELIPAWSKGEARAPGKPRPATTSPPPDTLRELLSSAGRAPIRLWAAFTLSGPGR